MSGSIIAILNKLGALFCNHALAMLIQSSILIVVLLIIDLLLRKRIRAVFRYCIWLLVFVKLVIPPTLSLPTGIGYWCGDYWAADSIAVETTGAPAADHAEASVTEHSVATSELLPLRPAESFVENPVAVTSAVELASPSIDWQVVILLGWFLGVLVLAVLLMQRAWFVRGLIAQSELAEGKLIDILNDCYHQLGIRKRIELKISQNSLSPAACGLFKPKIILPSSLLACFSRDKLQTAILHELVHIKRGDLWVNFLQTVLQIVYFYNPLLWLTNAIVRRIREQAVDETILVYLGDKANTYSSTLVDIAEVAFARPTLGLHLIGVVESRKVLADRIKHIVSRPFPKSAKLSFVGLLAIIITAAIFLPMAGSEIRNNKNDNSGIVQGIAKNKEGQVISSAKILLYHNISRWGLGNKVEQQTTSAVDGSFIFSNPLSYSDVNEYPKGRDSYIILATHPDYALGWCNITKGQEESSYELILTKPKSQTITVTDHEGNPLTGVRVWPYNIGNPAGPEALFRDTLSVYTDIGIVGGTTGADGKAIITNLPQTRCSFHATLKGYATGLVFSGQKTIRLNKGATVSGSVLDEDGKPVENALVKFHTNWGMWQFFLAKTDSQGRFRFEDLPAEGWDMSPWGKSENADGSYVITTEHDDYISPETQDQLQPGDVKENFIIDAYRGTLVKCNVVEVDTNRPVVGARIQGSNESGRIDGRSDSNGVFTFRVMPGQVSLFFTSPPTGVYVLRDQNRPELKQSMRFDVQGDEMTVTLKIPKIAGRLTTVRGKVHLPDSTPAADVKIFTTNSSSYNTSTWSGAGGAYTGTNSDGTFELNNVPVGLKLFLYGNTKDFKYILTETIDSVDDPTILSAPLVMQQGQIADVLFTDEQGKPRANMSLKITPMMWGNHIPRADSHYGRTDVEGHLKINGIIPGMEYFIIDYRGDRGESGWWDKYYNETKILIPENGHKVEIQTTPSEVDIVKEEISGFVKDQDGNPINGASIELLNKDLVLLPKPEKLGETMRLVIYDHYYNITDTNGYFEFVDLNPGKTNISVKVRGYRTEILREITTGTENLRITLGKPSAYRLAGDVVDGKGNPISGVEITLASESYTTVRTDEKGAFQFAEKLEPTTVNRARALFARKEGFGVWGKTLDTTGGQTYVKITLLPEEKISGCVVDEAGKPITNATILFWSCTGRNTKFFYGEWQEIAPKTQTDANGQFTFSGIPTESDVYLRAFAEGYASGGGQSIKTGKFGSYTMKIDKDRILVHGRNHGPDEVIEFKLQRAATLLGTVIYKNSGQPVQGLKIATQSHKGGRSAETKTDQAGRFELEGVSPNPCNLLVIQEDLEKDSPPEWTAAAIEFDDLREGETRGGIKLVLTKGGIIRGKAVDAEGNPLHEIDIAFYSAARPRSGAACQHTNTAKDGSWAYRFPPGEVYVYIRTTIREGSWSRKSYTLHLKDGQVIDNIDFELSQVVPENSPYRRKRPKKTVVQVEAKSSESKNTEDYDKIPSGSVVVRVVDTKGRIISIKDVPYTRIYYRDATTGNPIGWQIDLQIEKTLSDGSLLVNHRDVLVRKFLDMNRETKRNDYTISMCFQPKEGPVFSSTMLYPQKATDILSFVVPPKTKVAGVGNVTPDELAGRVVDVDGNPVAGATISVYPDRGLENHPFKTDSQGAFRIPGFGDRWCLYIKVEKDGYATQWLTDFEIGKSFIVTMDQSTVLQGVFVNDSGEQAGRTHITLAKNKLTMQPRRGNDVGHITITHETDDKGSYDFSVEPGLYDVSVASESGLFNRLRVFIGAGQIVSLPSTLKPGIRFQVKVVDSLTNKPIKGVSLWIDSRTAGRVAMKEGSQRKTNWRGSAVWESLMPGNTSFSIMKKGYCRWWSDACLRGFGTFKPDSNRGGYNWQRNIDSLGFDLVPDMPVVVIKMEKGVKLSGRVLSPEGKPVAKAWVDVTPAENPGTLTGDSRYRMITDEDGRFGIEEKYYRGYVPAGKQVLYNLCAHDHEGRWANAVSKPFASKPGDEFEFTLKMTKGGWVSGRVIDSEDKPVPDIEVEAVAKDNLDSPYFKPRTLTDENGTFTLGPMREGKYGIQPDTMKGVNIARSPKQEKTEVKVVDGKVTSVGNLLFRTGGPNM